MLNLRRDASGVTLIELMIGIAILSVLLGIAVPSFRTWIQNGKVRTAAESIQNGLQIARVEAIQRNSPVQFDLRDGGAGGAWAVCLQPDPAGACPNPDDASTIQSRSGDEGSSAAVTVEIEEGAVPVVFNAAGRVREPAGGVELLVDTSALTEAESRELRIIVSPSGSIRVCEASFPAGSTDLRACP